MTDTQQTTDLVARLRQYERGARQQCQCSSREANCAACDCGHAADEIEQLRHILETIITIASNTHEPDEEIIREANKGLPKDQQFGLEGFHKW